MDLINGSCNCKIVKFQVDIDKLKIIVNCHCNLCKEMNGSVFSTYAVFLNDGFELISGNEYIKTHQATKNAIKYFCTNCGTPLYNLNPVKHNGITIVYYGSVPGLRLYSPTVNTYCESKLDWLSNLDNLNNFQKSRL